MQIKVESLTSFYSFGINTAVVGKLLKSIIFVFLILDLLSLEFFVPKDVWSYK